MPSPPRPVAPPATARFPDVEADGHDGAASESTGGGSTPTASYDLPSTGRLVPLSPGSSVLQPPGGRPRLSGNRGPEDLFDYAQPNARRPPAVRPGWVGGVLRGTTYTPVFADGGNWFTRGLSDAGNFVVDAIGKGLSGLVHSRLEKRTEVPITNNLLVGFHASGRKVREDELPIGDPRRIAIAELQRQHPGALPLWIEGNFGQDLAFNLGHSVPLGATGASVRFGFAVGEDLGFTMQRLMFVPGRINGGDIAGAGQQLARLRLGPLSGQSVAQMETGATFRFTGGANLRVDAALGFGTAVPALNNIVQLGADVEAGSYAALSGNFSLQMQRLEAGRARVTFSAEGTGESGVRLRAMAGVVVNHHEVSRLLRGFVDYVAKGGRAEAFREQLTNERERELASDLSGYMRLLVKNLADGAGTAILDGLVDRYATLYLEARAGFSVRSDFSTTVDFDLASDATVELPRADMVPAIMRRGTAAGEPLRLRVGEVAQLAYDMAVRGDLRLVQQLALIRGSGVRINEEVRSRTTSRASKVRLDLPFIEFESSHSTSDTLVERYTAELGRTRTAIAEFNQHYHGIFNDAQDAKAAVRVHAPEGKENATLFFGSDENFSADFVVQGLTDAWTSYEELQNYLGVLNALSGGRLEARAREALMSGRYRHDGFLDDINPIHQLFFKPREFGRTIVHLHVWLGEEGLRQLLESNLSADQMYGRIAEVFANLEGKDRTGLPAWARRGGDRTLVRRGQRVGTQGGPAVHYGVGQSDHDLGTARYLVDNILALRARMKKARTPTQEAEVARRIRDFLRDAHDKLPAYAALANLVPEQHRAVEMRLSAIREGAVPLRFAFIQDGRTSDLLYATGVARMAMQQWNRYGALLDTESRLRLGNLLGEVHQILNAPSPDPFLLHRALRALDGELGLLDARTEEMGHLIESDLGKGRAFLSALPSADTITAVLPGALGAEMARLRLTAWRAINAPNPDVALLRALFKDILHRMPIFRRISAAAPLVTSAGRLANTAAAHHPELVQQTRQALEAVRRTIVDKAAAPYEHAIAQLTAAHAHSVDVLGESADPGALLQGERRGSAAESGTGSPSTSHPPTASELSQARAREGERFRALAGNPQVAPLSYFERTGVVPTAYIPAPYKADGAGVVTAAMITEAQLAMATTRPTGELPVPRLTQKSVQSLLQAARSGDGSRFLRAAEQLSFTSEQWFDDPRRHVLEYFLLDLPESERRQFLTRFSTERRASLERVFSEQDALQQSHDEERHARARFLRENPRLDEDLRFLKELYKRDPAQLEAAFNDLGYGAVLDSWHARRVARLEPVLSHLSGDELNNLVGKMNGEERKRFLNLLQNSDLRPQTRAHLAGQIVDDAFFWKQQEDLVAALVTGMNAGDLHIFFDQLHTDGKLEDFLDAGGFWQSLLVILTFGIASLFTHDNEAAMRVVARYGWNADEIRAEYGAKTPFVERIEKDAERVYFESVLATAPMEQWLRQGLRVVHGIIGNVKYYHFADFPEEARRVLGQMAAGAGRQLVRRLIDVGFRQKGSPSEIVAEYKHFFAGLSPKAIQAQTGSGDLDGSVSIIAKALADGALGGFIEASFDPRNHFITPRLVASIVEATNALDNPVSVEPGARDPHLSADSHQGLLDKWSFVRQYTGFDYTQMRLIYGGLAVAAPAVAFGPYVSIARDQARLNSRGELEIDDYMQQVIAFHESTHTMQQLIYGERVNAFIDQAIAISSGSERDAAYQVTAQRFDAARSIHDFQEHWEQQAELMEQSLRMLWSRRQETGSSSPAIFEAYPGPGRELEIIGAKIELTPERWQKMLQFVHEFGGAARRASGRSGGSFVYQPTRDTHGGSI